MNPMSGIVDDGGGTGEEDGYDSDDQSEDNADESADSPDSVPIDKPGEPVLNYEFGNSYDYFGSSTRALQDALSPGLQSSDGTDRVFSNDRFDHAATREEQPSRNIVSALEQVAVAGTAL